MTEPSDLETYPRMLLAVFLSGPYVLAAPWWLQAQWAIWAAVVVLWRVYTL